METSSLTPGQQMSYALDISVDEAENLTRLIKGKLEGILDQIYEVHQLILEAHDRKAWQALGYPTWQQYVKKEFNLSRSRSYGLLDRARVQQTLLAAGVGAAALLGTSFEDSPSVNAQAETPPVRMSARAVRALKPQLPQAEAEVKKLVQDGASIPHALQTVVDLYGRPIERDDVAEEESAFSVDIARQVEHEAKVWKFSNAVVALSEFAGEPKAALALIAEDSKYLPHEPVTQDHIYRAWQALTTLVRVQVEQR
jgi:hypothetical protein